MISKAFICGLLHCGLILLGPRISAQTFHVTLSPKHLAKVDKGKSIHERMKTYRKLYSRDSARHIRKLNKYYQHKTDSLYKANRREERLRALAAKQGVTLPQQSVIRYQQLGSLLSSDSTDVDSLKQEGAALARSQLQEQLPAGQQRQLQELQSKYGAQSTELRNYLTLLRDSAANADTLKSLALSKASATANTFAEKKVSEYGGLKEFGEYDKTLKEIQGMPGKYKSDMERYTNYDQMKEDGKKKALEEAAERAAQQLEKLKPVQQKMSLLKNKYSSLLNSNDLSTGVKARSLEGHPLRERWVIGGTFNIPSTAPLMVDLNPQFGYKLDKTFQVGVGGIYRAKFVDSVKYVNAPAASVYGGSIFANHALIWNFFAYAEWQHVNQNNKGATQDRSVRIWTDNLLIGVGRRFNFTRKISGALLFLWNPLHNNTTSTYPNAFVIKTGVYMNK